MKNANQIRQFIKNWQAEAEKYTTKTKFEAVLVDVINTKCDSILTLLPCETCNGTEIKPPEEGCGYCLAVDGSCWADCPCPDCQKKPIDK